jgi:hypothetical protein
LKNEDIHTDQQLQGLFQSFEPPLPKGAWEGIEDSMNRKQRRRVALWWIAAVAALAGCISGLWFVLSDTQYTQKSVKKQEMTVNTPSDSQIKPSKNAETISTQDNIGKKDIQTGRVKVNQIQNEPISNNPAIPENYEPNRVGLEPVWESKSGQVALPDPFGLRLTPQQWPAVNDVRAVKIAVKEAQKVADSMKANMGKWTLSAALYQMQTGNGYAVNPEYSRYVHKNYLSRMKEGELNMGGTGFAIHLGYQMNQKYAITGGVQFRQLNIRQQFNFTDEVPVTLMPGNTPDEFGNYPIIGYFGNAGSVTYSGFQRNTIVEIPLGMNADFRVTPKWSVKPAIFVNTGFVGGINGFTLDYQQLQLTAQRSEWFRKVQMSGSLSLGAFRQINRKLQWGATIGGTRMLTPAYIPNASVRPRNHSLGIGTQLNWRID